MSDSDRWLISAARNFRDSYTTLRLSNSWLKWLLWLHLPFCLQNKKKKANFWYWWGIFKKMALQEFEKDRSRYPETSIVSAASLPVPMVLCGRFCDQWLSHQVYTLSSHLSDLHFETDWTVIVHPIIWNLWMPMSVIRKDLCRCD